MDNMNGLSVQIIRKPVTINYTAPFVKGFMSTGTEKTLSMIDQLIGKEVVASALNKEVVYNKCEGCPYGTYDNKGGYECYSNECPYYEEEEE